jgi:phage terminase small subunit
MRDQLAHLASAAVPDQGLRSRRGHIDRALWIGRVRVSTSAPQHSDAPGRPVIKPEREAIPRTARRAGMTMTKDKATKPARMAKAGTSKAAASHRKRLFVEAFITNGGNATRAAIAAGYSPKTAEQQASRLLTDVKVSGVLEKRRAEALAKVSLTTERTLRGVAQLAYSDLRKLYNEDGVLKKPHEWDDDMAAAVAMMEVKELFEGFGEHRRLIGYLRKIKLFDKNAALEKAMRHLGLFEKDNAQAPTAVARVFVLPQKQNRDAK